MAGQLERMLKLGLLSPSVAKKVRSALDHEQARKVAEAQAVVDAEEAALHKAVRDGTVPPPERAPVDCSEMTRAEYARHMRSLGVDVNASGMDIQRLDEEAGCRPRSRTLAGNISASNAKRHREFVEDLAMARGEVAEMAPLPATATAAERALRHKQTFGREALTNDAPVFHDAPESDPRTRAMAAQITQQLRAEQAAGLEAARRAEKGEKIDVNSLTREAFKIFARARWGIDT